MGSGGLREKGEGKCFAGAEFAENAGTTESTNCSDRCWGVALTLKIRWSWGKTPAIAAALGADFKR